MALTTTANRVGFSGNGVTTVWPFTFPIPDATYLSVIYTDATGVDTTLSSSLYSVTGIGTTTGGNVTYPLVGSPIAASTKLTLVRTVPYTQTTVLSNQGGYYPEVLEARLDLITMEAQQLADAISRALVAPASDAATIGALPTATARASSVLGFDASGNPYAASSIGTTAVSAWLAANFLPMTTAATALASLGGLATSLFTTRGDLVYRNATVPARLAIGTSGQVLTSNGTDPAWATPASSGTPQGRLTLTSATPVLTATVSAAATVYYALYTGNQVPIYNGSSYSMTTFTELSNATAQSSTGSAGPAVVANNSNYDLFVWSNGGTPTLTRGPLWTSDTGRGTGAGTTEISRVLGIYTNVVAITNGPGAGLGTYVGTIRSNGTATIDFIKGATAANGTAAVLGVWNCYNRVDVRGTVADTTDSWVYETVTTRPANNSSTMRVSFVCGLQEDYFEAEYSCTQGNTNGNAGGYAGVGLDSTTTFSGRYNLFRQVATASGALGAVMGDDTTQSLGFHYYQALEKAFNTQATNNWYGDFAGTVQNGLRYRGKF